MKRAGRSMYRMLYWLPLLAILGLAMFINFLVVLTHGAVGAKGTSIGPVALFFMAVGSFLFLGWLILGRWIAYWLVPLFVTKIKCPGCGEEMNTVGVWNCSCGFHDHRERNILTKRCPKCGMGAGHLNCPRCECTILLW